MMEKKKTFTFGMKRNTCLFALYEGAPIPRDINISINF